MNWIDFLIIGIVSVSIYFGVKKGFFSSLFSFLASLIGFYAAGYASNVFASVIGNNKIINWAVFTSVFVIVAWILGYLGKFIRFVGRIIISEFADRIFGLGIGILRGIVVCGFILFCILMLDIDKSRQIRKSVIAPALVRSVKTFILTSPAKIKTQVESLFI